MRGGVGDRAVAIAPAVKPVEGALLGWHIFVHCTPCAYRDNEVFHIIHAAGVELRILEKLLPGDLGYGSHCGVVAAVDEVVFRRLHVTDPDIEVVRWEVGWHGRRRRANADIRHVWSGLFN